MSTILVVGDGPLAAEIAALAEQASHTVIKYLFAQEGPQSSPLAAMPAYVQEVADTLDLTIEAVIASREVKKQTIVSLNTAFIGTTEPILTACLNASASEVGGWSVEPGNVVGWAGLPPLAAAEVLEVLPGLRSDPAMLGKAEDFLRSLGKEPVRIADCVGGVLPRVVANLANEAAFALMEGVASAEDIDQAMQLGTNYPHGPLAWADRIGLDQVAGVLGALGEFYGADRYRAAPLLRQLVSAGLWGERTGKGFYSHE
jgi:3-hydroxybutyryl-CoA dehydrogenase